MTTKPAALALVCSLKPIPAESSTELMAGRVLARLSESGVEGTSYWNGEAMQTVDYRDLDTVPDAVASTTSLFACSPGNELS